MSTPLQNQKRKLLNKNNGYHDKLIGIYPLLSPLHEYGNREQGCSMCARQQFGFRSENRMGGHEISKFSDGNSNGNLLHESPQV